MFAKFSVQKPLTVFVSVFMVIILGFVSFSSMTPDLLPGINLPYAVVITAYPGATPEEVEEQISKPLEQSMATLENINSISSTSAESMSTIMLEFNDSVNMDTMVSEIREKINGVSGFWDDLVQTPYIIKINPNLLPVTVAAVEYDGMSNTDLTRFIEDEIITDLEGITGVASLDISGNVTEQIHVILSQDKIDKVNKDIEEAILEQFAEGEQELEDGMQEITDGITDIESQESDLDGAKNELESGQTALAQETAKAHAQLVDQKIEVEATITELKSQMQTAESSKPLIEGTLRTLKDVQAQYNSAITEKNELEKELAGLVGTDPETLARVEEINNRLDVLDATLGGIDAILSAMGYTVSDVETAIADSEAQLEQILSGVTELETAIAQLEQGSVGITAAMEELNKQQLSGAMEISAGISQISDAQTALASAKMQLDSAETELQNAKDSLEEQKELALESAKLDITMDMVNQILMAQNFSMPAGYITEDDVDYLIRVGNKIEGVEELQDLMILNMGIDGLDPVRLSDVADVFITDNSGEMYSKVNGNDSLMLSFSKQASFATKTVSDNVLARFDELEDSYDGLKFSILSDQGQPIDLIVGNVLSNILSGGVLAIIILILFLKDIRPTFIIACSIPISLLFAIVLMYFSGIGLNIISLSGLAVGVGMLVDNSVVVIENIYRLRSEGEPILKAAVKGTTQVTGAILASTLTTICVFLPIVFIEGLTRDLFQDMALTVGYSLLASFIIAITLVPAMASGMLKVKKEKKSPIMDGMINAYGKLVSLSLKHNWVVLVLSVILLVGSTFWALSKGFIFMPSMSGTQITVSVTAPEGATFEEATVLADEVYERIKDVEGVETFGVNMAGGGTSSMLSGAMGGGGSGGTGITIYAILENGTNRKDSEISAEIVEKTADINATISAQGSMDMSSMMTAMGGEGISVTVYGKDLDNLIQEADNLAATLGEIDGISEVSTGLEDANPEIRIVVDKDKAMEKGLTVAQVFGAVSANVSSEVTGSDIVANGVGTDMIIYSEKNQNLKTSDIEDMVIKYQTMTGEKEEVALTDVADILETKSLDSISRENQRRTLTVSAKIAEDQNITLMTNKVNDVLDDYETLPGNTIETGGENDSIMEAMEQLIYMAALAIVIIYFIMVAQFQSFKLPFIVMFTIPLACTGGFLALLITGHEVSVISMVGFIMLAGIIVNNGIVLIDYINVMRYEGVEKREAIVLAGKTRMRPILMTALTTILGLVFMALATGVGSEMMQPMAIVCIGGLTYATLMTLFVVPAMYDILSKNKMEKRIVD